MVRHRTNVHLFPIKEFKNNIDTYTEFIIGTPIYAGTINKKIKQFLEKNEEILLEKPLIIFLSGMQPDKEQDVINLNFSDAIIKHAKIKYVGGAFQFKKMNFLFKAIVKKIAKTTDDQEVLLDENIEYLLK